MFFLQLWLHRYDTANILHSYNFSLQHVFLIFCAARRADWGRAARIDRDRAVLDLGALGPPGHVREDPFCDQEVLCSRELRMGRRDSSPSAPPNVVVELHLDSGFAADALFSTNGRNYCGFVIILYSNRTGRPPPIPTVGPRQQPPPPMYTLGGSRQPAF
jgi:hypothetical protein